VSESRERIPRRPLPDFEESEEGMKKAIAEAGFLNVALNDVNQYGLTGLILLLLMLL